MGNLFPAAVAAMFFILWTTASEAQSPAKDIGRIEYSVQPLTPTHTPYPSEYVGLRLKIVKFGSGGVLSVKDPDFGDEITFGVFDQTKHVFVGIRFTNGPFELLSSTAGASTAAVPFFTVLQTEEGTVTVAPPHSVDNELVLGPREAGSGDVALQISTEWGTSTKMTIPEALFSLAEKAATAYVSLPAGLANAGLSTSLTSDDRTKADAFFSNALSFDTKDVASNNGPDGINTIGITNDELTNGVVVDIAVFDRAATDTGKRKLIVEFQLSSEFRPSVLPDTPTSPPTDAKTLYTNWNANSNIIAGDPSTSVAGILGKVPADSAIGSPVTNMAAASTSFGAACVKLPSYFGALGFNRYDQNALTWATLTQSGYLASIPTLSAANQQAAVTTQSPYGCPGDATNRQFASVGLSAVPTIRQRAVPATTPPAISDMKSTLYKFAHDWANPTAAALQSYFDPTLSSEVNFVRDTGNVLGIPADGPIDAPTLATALAGSTSRIGSFQLSSAQPTRWCVTFTVKGKSIPGSILFDASNGKIIDELNMASAPDDCSN